MNKKATFGYEWKNGELVINEKESSIVKWIYSKVSEYTDNPPDYLIRETMEYSEEELTYDEARKKVSLSKILPYVTAELNVRIKEFEIRQADDIQKFLESELDSEMTAALEKEYILQKVSGYAGGVISPREGRYIGKAPKRRQGFKNIIESNEPFVSKEMYESAVKKIQEGIKHISKKEQDDDFRQRHFFKRIDALLPTVDLYKLDESFNSSDDSYAKEVLKKINDIFFDVYGADYLERSNEFAEMPAVIRGQKSGHVGLAIINIDIKTGEQWRIHFLTPRGIIERHKYEIFSDDYNYVMETYPTYDYWYTGDKNIDFENEPDDIINILKSYNPDQQGMKME